ncbi:hypothetical protein [Jannaschia formosa]|uniref:hypothetical protein n=1 Tax=Jannaschia formosa TaxID=2259592 RepID=UPI000E1BF914|nr:hypothetical protein [Jannaschia formosa]TFL17980.1 hypothetical protein DR046_12545 [Jannaschia formosa]
MIHFFEHRTDLSAATRHQYLNSLRVLDPFLGNLLLGEIDGATLRNFMVTLRKQVSDASLRRDLATGSSIFSTAQETMSRQVPDVNPFRMILKRHLKEVKRTRYLTEDEYDRVEKALTQE